MIHINPFHSEVPSCPHSPTAPFQKALGPSILQIFLAQSKMPLYVACPFRALTCSRVLITSAGVSRPAAGTPEGRREEGG